MSFKKLIRCKPVVYLASFGILMSALLGSVVSIHQLKGIMHRQTFGTRSAPAFNINYAKKITSSVYQDTLPALREETEHFKLGIKSVNDYLAGFDAAAERIKSCYCSLDESIDQALSMPEPDKDLIDRIVLQALEAPQLGTLHLFPPEFQAIHEKNLEKRIEKNKADDAYFKSTVKDEEQKYGDVIERSKALFEKLTGKKCPLNHINLREISEKEKKRISSNVAGYNDNGRVIVQPMSYARTLLTIMHEFGHSVAQHEEEAYYKAIIPELTTKKKLRLLELREEVCAYLFEMAAAHVEENQELASQMKEVWDLESKPQISLYFNGDPRVHPEAVAIADAAATYFGDPGKAFQQLSTAPADETDSGILDILEKNKGVYKQNLAFYRELCELEEQVSVLHRPLQNFIIKVMDKCKLLIDKIDKK